MSEIGPWLIIAASAYIALLLGIGIAGRRARRGNSPSDFFLAGRGLGLLTLLLTLYATQYSGNTFVGYAAQGYRLGPAFLYGVLTLASVPAVYLLFAPRLRRVASKHNLVTFGDYIQHRFRSRTLTMLVSAASTVALVNFIITNLIALGIIIEVLTAGRVSYLWSVLILAAVMVIYEILGGLRSVTWTDMLQGVLILAGSIFLLGLTLSHFGGLEPALALLRAEQPLLLEPPDLAGNVTWISSILVFAIAASIYPHALQRIYAAKSTANLKRALAIMVFLPFVTSLPAITWGVLGNALFPGLSAEASEQITPLILEQLAADFPALYWGIILFVIAVLAAIMSTIDSALLSSSSALVTDFAPVSERRRTAAAKVVSVLVMAIAVGVALVFRGNIFGLIEIKFELLLPCAPSLYFGLYWRRITAPPLIAGFLAGVALTVALLLGGALSDFLPQRPLGVHAGLWGLLLNIAVTIVLARLRAVRAERA